MMWLVLLMTMVTAAAEDLPPNNLLVAVTAPWCGPCRELEPILRAMRRDGWNVRIVDLDRHRAHPWIVRHRIAGRGVPCLVLCLDPEGRWVWQIRLGARSRASLEGWIRAAGRK